MDELTPEESRRLLERGEVAHLAVIDNGRPYVTPTSYVVDGDVLYFRTGVGRRLAALRANPDVCLNITGWFSGTGMWESVVVYGSAGAAADQAEYDRAVELLRLKYRGALHAMEGIPADAEEPIELVTVTIESVTGRTSGRYGQPRTRPARF